MYKLFGLDGFLLYNIFTIYISSLALLIFNLTQIKAKRKLLTGPSQAIISHCEARYPHRIYLISTILAIVEIVLISLFQHGLVSPLNKYLGNLLYTGANYFGLIFAMPVLLPIFCWIIGVDPLKQIDLITPAYPLALFFMKFGCFFLGCCRGIPCSFGMYNLYSKRTEIPMQLIEAVIALMLFLFLLYHRKKAKEGTLFPIYIILYCAIRFFSEFLRWEPSVIWFLKTYHILCLIGVLLGTVQLIIVLKCKNIINRVFSKNLPYLLFFRKK